MTGHSQPFRHTLADFFWTDQFPAIGLLNASFDLVEQVEPIESIFDAGVVWKILNGLQYLLLRLHGGSPIPLRILALPRSSLLAACACLN
jgi:hypothetical protein